MTTTQTQPPGTRTVAGFSTLTARDLMRPVDDVISEQATLREVVEHFTRESGRHLIVLDPDGRCVGVLGPRHVAQAHRFDARRDEEIPVGELGYAAWIALSPPDDIQTCARALVEHDLDAIPVLGADQRALGIVTIRDIARAAADFPAPVPPQWEE